jgi:hypothetical protein
MKIDINDFNIKHKASDSYYFTTSDHGEFKDEENNFQTLKETDQTYAKKIKNKLSRNMLDPDNFAFFVKSAPNKKIYDPFEIHSSIKEKPLYGAINKVCKTTDSFIQVPETIFNQYVTFLKTNNRKLFTKIQREVG